MDVLLGGGPRKADLLVVDVGQGPLVVKDFAAKSWWVRLLGRLQIAREFRAYRWLGRMPGIPALIGRVDSHAIALEKVDGVPLFRSPGRTRDGPALLAKLRELLDRMHERGLVHLDLRGRENLILCPDGRLVVLDLAGAVCFRKGGLGRRLLFPLLAIADEAAYLKWKEMLDPDRFTPREEAFRRRFRLLRSLWIFNPKKR